MSTALSLLSQQFAITKLRFYVQFQQNTQLPSFKGSMLHGLLGHALKATDEKAFFILYGEHDKQQPKPYMVCPNQDLKTEWRKDEMYYFDIVLFGHATALAQQVVAAIEHAQLSGIGGKRTAFSLISVASILPTKIASGIHSTTLAQWISPTLQLPYNIETELAIHLSTPIRIKSAGHIVKKHAPRMNEWLNHILRRLIQLSRFWVLEDDELFQQLYQQRPNHSDYEITQHLYFEDWQRYSLKEKNHLPFGGLQGQISYFGDISQCIPLLALGQHINIGGKTTFGLGAYTLIY
jgi:hypothetical protein